MQFKQAYRLKFDPDKRLFFTQGDPDRLLIAQDLKMFSGKLLRINDNDNIPRDNPFVKNNTPRREIWTYDYRNTQGKDFQPETVCLFNSDRGPSGGDEVKQIRKELNYGRLLIHHRDTVVQAS